MIDPLRVDALASDIPTLEEFLLFCICVANKPAQITAQKLETFLSALGGGTPFDKVRSLLKAGTLQSLLAIYKFGQYKRIGNAFTDAVHAEIDLRKCTTDELEQIRGIGPKTSRYYILYTQPDSRVACLDTHILKYLAFNGIVNVPKSTPQSKVAYHRLESAFLDLADVLGMKPAELDLKVWTWYRSKQ